MRFKNGLPLLDADRQQRRNRVSQYAGVFDFGEKQPGAGFLRQGGKIDFRPDLIRFENSAEQGSGLDRLAAGLFNRCGLRHQEFFLDGSDDRGAFDAGYEEFEGSVQQRDVMYHARGNADRIQRIPRRIIVGGAFLRHHENTATCRCGARDRAFGFLPADEDRYDHLWKQHKIAEREDRNDSSRRQRRPSGCRHRRRRLACLNPRGQEIPVGKTKSPGDQFQALAVGQGYGFGLHGFAQGLRHGFGIAKVAHRIFLCIGEREMSGACVTDSFAWAKGA